MHSLLLPIRLSQHSVCQLMAIPTIMKEIVPNIVKAENTVPRIAKIY